MAQIVYEGIRYEVPDDFVVIFNGSSRRAGDLVDGTVVDVNLPGNVPAGTPLDVAFPNVAEVGSGGDDKNAHEIPKDNRPPNSVLVVLRGGDMYYVPEDGIVTVNGRQVRAGDLEDGTVVGSIAVSDGVVHAIGATSTDTSVVEEGQSIPSAHDSGIAAAQRGDLDTGPASAPSDHDSWIPAPATGTPAGGAGGAGGAGASPATTDTAAGADLGIDYSSKTDAELEEIIREEMGTLAWVLDVPELRTLVFNSLRSNEDANGIYRALQNSEWWKTTEPQLRAYTQMLSEDPAQAQRLRTNVGLSIRLEALQLGVQIDPSRIDALADQALRLGWVDINGQPTANLLTVAVLNESRWRPEDVGPGSLQVTIESLQQEAGDWMVPISEQTAGVWAERIALGETTADAFSVYMQDLASSRFPHLRGIIEQGISPRAHFQPYREMAANMLQVTPDEIDLFNDPRFAPMVESHTEQGVRAMTLAEAQRHIRSMPEWQNGVQGLTTTARTLEALLAGFGERA